MSIFKFNSNPNRTQVKKVEPLVVDLTTKDAPKVKEDTFLAMLREGKMPLPDSWQKFTNEHLAEMGYPRVLWSKKYKTKYCLMRIKPHDS